MTIADELRRDANAALKELKETGVHYDVEYLSSIARKVEAIVAENAQLRELVRIALEYCANGYCEDGCPMYVAHRYCKLHAKARELGIETE